MPNAGQKWAGNRRTGGCFLADFDVFVRPMPPSSSKEIPIVILFQNSRRIQLLPGWPHLSWTWPVLRLVATTIGVRDAFSRNCERRVRVGVRERQRAFGERLRRRAVDARARLADVTGCDGSAGRD